MEPEPGLSIESLSFCLGGVLKKHPVELAYLYGSAATGRMTPFSDVDIALVLASNAVSPSERLKFELMIEDRIAEACSLSQADVRVINDAPLVLRGQVVTEGILLFARDEEQRIEFETRTRTEYFDFLPVVETLRQAFFDDILERGLHGQPA